MTQGTQDRFRRILEAARKRDGGSSTDTMIVNSHLSQMKLFMLRQGLEFYPSQDSYGSGSSSCRHWLKRTSRAKLPL